MSEEIKGGSKVKTMVVQYKDIQLSLKDAGKIRGFFANQSVEDSVLHNHRQDGSAVYQYPKVQYKVIHGHPMIVAYGEGIGHIYPFIMKNETIQIGEKCVPVGHYDIKLSESVLGDRREQITYCFLSPWLCLNQSNYRKYKEESDKEALLKRVLIGNVLSLCKGFGVRVNGDLKPELKVKECLVSYKNEQMIGFHGTFSINYRLPDYVGLGKGVAKGLGTSKKVGGKGETWV